MVKNNILFFSIIFIFIPPILKAEEKKEQPTAPKWKFLEFLAGSTQVNARGPETLGSLLSSMRLVSALTSSSDELYRDKVKNTENSLNSRFRFSQKLGDYFYYSLILGTGSKIRYDRESIGNKGTVLEDNTSSSQNYYGFRIGLGPLDYLSSFSYEFSIGLESIRQSGPFQTNGYRFPSIRNQNLARAEYLLGEGNFQFNTNSFIMNYGVSTTGDIFGVYANLEFQFLGGNSRLNSASLYPNTTTQSITPFLGNQDLQLANIKINNLKGFIYLIESGIILKFTESIGLRVGGYYQIAALVTNNISGYYYENGRWNEASSSSKIISAQSRNSQGFYGINIGVLTRF